MKRDEREKYRNIKRERGKEGEKGGEVGGSCTIGTITRVWDLGLGLRV